MFIGILHPHETRILEGVFCNYRNPQERPVLKLSTKLPAGNYTAGKGRGWEVGCRPTNIDLFFWVFFSRVVYVCERMWSHFTCRKSRRKTLVPPDHNFIFVLIHEMRCGSFICFPYPPTHPSALHSTAVKSVIFNSLHCAVSFLSSY